jgi:uncharacterized repeat protein (TIGR02543 family)
VTINNLVVGNDYQVRFTEVVGRNTPQTQTGVVVSNGQNTTLTGTYSAKTHTVSYDLNYTGVGLTAPASKQVTYGGTYGTLPTPTRNGYTFNGWFTTEQTGGTQVTASTTVSITQNNQKLYARWTANSLTVTFNTNWSVISNGQRR